jgi:hypothetical protein
MQLVSGDYMPKLQGEKKVSRPTYESSTNVAKELEIAAKFCSVFDCTYEQYPPLHAVNGKFVKDGKVQAIAEIKVRNNASNKYPTLMMSSSKYRKGLDWAHKENAPFLLVIKFTDGLFMTKVGAKYQESIGGRKDRNDPDDIERCVYIPMDSFKQVAAQW